MKNRSTYKPWRSLGIDPWNSPWPKNVKQKTPGEHGVKHVQLRNKLSRRQDVDHSAYRYEKKRILTTYANVKKRQFAKYLKISRTQNIIDTTETNPLHRQLNQRLDSWIFRIGFAKSPFHARQLINHRKVYVDNKCVTSCSYRLHEGNLIELRRINLQNTLMPKGILDLDSFAEINYLIGAAIVLKPSGLNNINDWTSFHLVNEHIK